MSTIEKELFNNHAAVAISGPAEQAMLVRDALRSDTDAAGREVIREFILTQIADRDTQQGTMVNLIDQTQEGIAAMYYELHDDEKQIRDHARQLEMMIPRLPANDAEATEKS